MTENLEITKVVASGAGLGRLDDGSVIFCDGALPGERVTIEITDRRRDFARGRLIDVLEASPDRVLPPCPHVERGCGGCTWQHVATGAQAGLKAAIVRDALAHIAHMPDVAVDVSAHGVAFGAHRTTLRLTVDQAGRPAFRKRATNQAVVVDSCLVTHPMLLGLMRESRFPGAREVVLRIGAATGERLAAPDRPGRGVTVPKGTRVSSPKHPAVVHEDVAGRRWQISALSFFQPGPQAAAALVDTVAEMAGAHPGCTLVDLYAGVGLIGGALADLWGNVSLNAIESHPNSADDARANLEDLNGCVLTGDVSDVEVGPADVVVADPSRTGLGRPGASAIGLIGAPLVILVSCDPASMARDAALLTELGYALERVEVVDLFPGTFHVETVSKFVRAG